MDFNVVVGEAANGWIPDEVKVVIWEYEGKGFAAARRGPGSWDVTGWSHPISTARLWDKLCAARLGVDKVEVLGAGLTFVK